MRINKSKQQHGFTLIEMIGVLAVIAILAAVLIPKVFEAINNSRINNAAMTCQTVKTAIADHYAKFGGLAINGSTGSPVVITNLPNPNYDQMLVSEGFLDKPFAVKISTDPGVDVELYPSGVATDAAQTVIGAFDLDGTGTANDATGSAVAVAVIPGVTANDAKDLNDRIDGTALASLVGGSGAGSGSAAAYDRVGRVKYEAPSGGTTTVYVYLTHR